jgi:hypothetical protein
VNPIGFLVGALTGSQETIIIRLTAHSSEMSRHSDLRVSSLLKTLLQQKQ